jgi:DNA-binding transcriptional ArsR family regulator
MDETEQERPAWRIEKRLTPALAKRGFTPVPSVFLDHYWKMKVTPTEAMVVVHLLSYKWTPKHPYPRLRVIADKMGLTPTTVRSYLRSLEKKNLVKRIPRSGQSNEFDLNPLFAKLEEIVKLEPPRKPSRRKRND